MKRIIRMIRLLRNIRRKERESMIQRFEILEHFLRCVQNLNQLAEFDKKCDSLLFKKDYHTDRYGVMMIRRFTKERQLCRTDFDLAKVNQREGEFILKQHGLI